MKWWQHALKRKTSLNKQGIFVWTTIAHKRGVVLRIYGLDWRNSPVEGIQWLGLVLHDPSDCYAEREYQLNGEDKKALNNYRYAVAHQGFVNKDQLTSDLDIFSW